MSTDFDYNQAQQVKLKGSKRFMVLISSLVLVSSVYIYNEIDTIWPFFAAGFILFLFFISVGDQHRISILFTVLIFAGSILGTIFWSWLAIPISIGVIFLLADIYGRWITQPLQKVIRNENDKT